MIDMHSNECIEVHACIYYNSIVSLLMQNTDSLFVCTGSN